MGAEEATVFAIEICRSVDYCLLTNTLAKNATSKLTEPDLSIILRGWNPLMQRLLSKLGQTNGIPLLQSTNETIQAATAELHRAGRSVFLRKTADLVRRGLLTGVEDGNGISLKIVSADQSDLFVDRLAEANLEELDRTYYDRDNENSAKINDVELKRRLANMVFPWSTPQGTMVGYKAEPDIDEHYITAVFDYVIQCRNKSGMHPSARIRGILVSDISQIILLVVSTRLKHTQLVHAGKKRYPDVNYWMSLTVWKPKSEIVESLSECSGIDRFIVSAIIEMLTLSPKSSPDFSSDVDPVLPLFFQISKQYLLEPVSTLFLNPFDTLLRICADNNGQQSITSRREEIMTENLNHLFLGNRYWRLETPVRLRKHRRILTDIDAAILDKTTGEMALFQLKWQNFRGATNNQINSRAKNFSEAVSKWADTVSMWLKENGLEQLRRSMKIPNDDRHPISKVYLFAIGQSNANFSYLGHVVENQALAVVTWPRLVRLRYDVGPENLVISALHNSLTNTKTHHTKPIPIPYEMKLDGTNLRFENLWNSFENSRSRQGSEY